MKETLVNVAYKVRYQKPVSSWRLNQFQAAKNYLHCGLRVLKVVKRNHIIDGICDRECPNYCKNSASCVNVLRFSISTKFVKNGEILPPCGFPFVGYINLPSGISIEVLSTRKIFPSRCLSLIPNVHICRIRFLCASKMFSLLRTNGIKFVKYSPFLPARTGRCTFSLRL